MFHYIIQKIHYLKKKVQLEGKSDLKILNQIINYLRTQMKNRNEE